jgi:2-polyprenyl-3-methyl-5-hydroxy-6-metoxy-1,4-benzoquinol methylase
LGQADSVMEFEQMSEKEQVHARIDSVVLKTIVRHHRRLGLARSLRGVPYERCAELAWIVGHLKARFGDVLSCLDIGSGESLLPTYILRNSCWQVTCLDKFESVQKQKQFLDRTGGPSDRFRVIQANLLTADLPERSFDVITNVSVIEHFEGNLDSAAMEASARLLKPGGEYVLTTLINEGFFREFYLDRDVYDSKYDGAPVYYQRHYDTPSLTRRIIKPSGLVERERIYFGEYGFQCFEEVLQRPKPLRVLYMWLTAMFAKRFASYRSYPVSRKDMRMNTASGVILVLTKPTCDINQNG